jgi:hypothetical protein
MDPAHSRLACNAPLVPSIRLYSHAAFLGCHKFSSVLLFIASLAMPKASRAFFLGQGRLRLGWGAVVSCLATIAKSNIAASILDEYSMPSRPSWAEVSAKIRRFDLSSLVIVESWLVIWVRWKNVSPGHCLRAAIGSENGSDEATAYPRSSHATLISYINTASMGTKSSTGGCHGGHAVAQPSERTQAPFAKISIIYALGIQNLRWKG